MSPKPRTAVYKDSVTAELALRAHFFIADEYPKDPTLAQHGQKMFLQVQHRTGVTSFTGEYYEACKRFADKNPEEMKCNDTCLDSVLRYQPSSYSSGEKLRPLAQDIARTSQQIPFAVLSGGQQTMACYTRPTLTDVILYRQGVRDFVCLGSAICQHCQVRRLSPRQSTFALTDLPLPSFSVLTAGQQNWNHSASS